MAGACGGNVDAVLVGHRLLVRKHIAGDQELARVQPAPDRLPRRCQRPRRQRWVPRRHALRSHAALGCAPRRRDAEPCRIWIGLARCDWANPGFASLGGEFI